MDSPTVPQARCFNGKRFPLVARRFKSCLPHFPCDPVPGRRVRAGEAYHPDRARPKEIEMSQFEQGILYFCAGYIAADIIGRAVMVFFLRRRS